MKLMLLFTFLACCSPGLRQEPPSRATPDDKGLAGTWVITSSVWCGKPLDLGGKSAGGKPLGFKFSGGRYEAFGGPGGPEDVGTYRIDPTKSPKELDLTPARGENRTPRKCAYALSGDELTIALSLWFSPGTPEAEERSGREMKAKRPATVTPGKRDLVLVLTLRRQKD